jgi:Uma2 family endonuclease
VDDRPGADFNLERIAAGYVPDLVVLDEDTFDEASEVDARNLTASPIELVVEVTSRWNAEDDRMPGPRRTKPTKWSGYASVGLPFSLLVDRDSSKPEITLYSDPDVRTAVYRESRTRKFGEVMALPEPFDLEIPTIKWKTWADDEL